MENVKYYERSCVKCKRIIKTLQKCDNYKICKSCAHKMRDISYSEDEEKFLKDNYPLLGRKKCSEILNRSPFSISIKVSKMGLMKLSKIININNKFCFKCNTELSKDNFGIDRKRKDGLHPTCKKCLINYRNTEEYKNRKRKYDLKRIKHKMKTDSVFKIQRYLRKRMNAALLYQGQRKTFKTNDVLGCTNAEFIEYLRSKFKSGMTLENHGHKGWHIDHIIPCASFDLSDKEQQRKCFHYTNLQPLWWYENLQKKDKIIV